jgi:hypothetical protein
MAGILGTDFLESAKAQISFEAGRNAPYSPFIPKSLGQATPSQ